ncbi:MAG: RNase adapter RapZ [Neisseriaceae bacterium]|nr:MAG: RNase adapter RapZ [Neisseriaceae bacterium]
MNLILVSGVSGSGKSIALTALEDLGFYCVDNLPSELLENLVNWHRQQGMVDKLAVSIDSRSKTKFHELNNILAQINHEQDILNILFFDACDDILMKRYSETRRSHPLQDNHHSLKDAIQEERTLLRPIREESLILDTSYMQVQDLRKWIQDWVGLTGKPFHLIFESFGFKFGTPLDADYIFDIRCLPNPYYSISFRNLVGCDDRIKDFFQQFPEVDKMIKNINNFLDSWIPSFKNTTRTTLKVAIGCTGGIHRSVYVVEQLAKYFDQQYSVLVRHRQLDYK